MNITPDELKFQFDNIQAYSKGYQDALGWIAQKLAENEKELAKGEKANGDTKVGIDKVPAKTSK